MHTNKKSGKIGIFWIYHGEVLARPIFIEDGESQGDLIDSPDSHVHAWDDPDGFMRDYHELMERNYEDIPRGRVLYESNEDRYVIYLDECLMNARDKAALKKAFSLSKEDCVFRSDPHYCTDSDAISRMFD
jgi:hypothetical protein